MQDRYGKESEILKAYVQDIIDLARNKDTENRKIHVQSLRDVKGAVPLTIDKLAGLRGDLVSNDQDWQSWDFITLRSWIRRNPMESGFSEDRDEIAHAKRDQGLREGYNTQQIRAWV